MYVKGPRYEYKLFNQSRAKLRGWIKLNNLTFTLIPLKSHTPRIHRVGDCQSICHHGQLTPSTVACVAGTKKGRIGGGGEKSEIPVPFSLPPNLLPLSMTATQATSTLEPLYNEGTDQICSLYKRGFAISRCFSKYFTITGVRNIVRYTKVFVL